nr:disintegrin and metalloproteinase domain-containing protein 11-like [Lytechinus pictus]
MGSVKCVGFRSSGRPKRSTVGRKRSAGTTLPQHYIKAALVFDETFHAPFNLDEKALEMFAVNLTTAVDQTFRKLHNTRIVLVAMETWMSKEHMNVSSPPHLMDRFQGYVTNALPKHHHIAFLIMFNSSDMAKSITNFDSICQPNRPAVGIIQVSDVSNLPRIATLISRGIATLISRGIATSMGILDDTDACQCEYNSCVMNTSTISVTPGFSDCSEKTFQTSYERRKYWCLETPPRNVELIEAPLCGNGIVETGEECDCGNDTACLSCCQECVLKEGAQCAGGTCCNTQCQLLLAGTLCRKRRGQCDIPEYCSGTSGNCPENLVLHNGAPCEKKGMCYAGFCSVMQDQCSQLWGEGSRLAGNTCPPNITAEITLRAPNHRDAKCGLLKCDVRDADLTSLQSRSFMELASWASNDPQCKVVSIALSDGTNRGAVPEGTACGKGRICRSGQCLPVERPSCPIGTARKTCSGNGACAITGDCICFCGWSGRSCSVRNSSREGVVCVPKSVFVTSDVTTNTEASPTESIDPTDEGQVRVLTSAIIGGCLAIIFVVAIIFGATSVGFRRARGKNNQARRMQQVKLFSMFQPTKQQKKRLAKFGGGRSPYKAGELEASTSSMGPTSGPLAGPPSSHSDNHHHHHHHHHHHQPKHHNHGGSGGQPAGRIHGKNKKQKKVQLLIDMDTHKPGRAGDEKARAETII